MSIGSGIARFVFKQFRHADGYLAHVDEILNNPQTRQILLQGLENGASGVDDAVRRLRASGQLSDEAAEALAQTGRNSMRSVLRQSASQISRHGDDLTELQRRINLPRGADGAIRSTDDLNGFLRSSNIGDQSYFGQALARNGDDVIRSLRSRSARDTALGALRGARDGTRAAVDGTRAVGRGIRGTYRAVTSPFRGRSQYKMITNSGEEVIDRRTYQALERQARGSGAAAEAAQARLDQIIQVPGNLSKWRMAAGAAGFFALEDATDGAITRTLITSDWSPVAFIAVEGGSAVVNGIGDVARAAGVDFSSPGEIPSWIEDSGAWQPEDGMILLDAETGQLLSVEDYEEAYNSLIDNDEVDVNAYMSPQDYAERYDALAAARAQYDIDNGYEATAPGADGTTADGTTADGTVPPAPVDGSDPAAGSAIPAGLAAIAGLNLDDPDLNLGPHFQTAMQAVNSGAIDMSGNMMFGMISGIANVFSMLSSFIPGMDGMTESLQRMALEQVQGQLANQGDNLLAVADTAGFTPAGGPTPDPRPTPQPGVAV